MNKKKSPVRGLAVTVLLALALLAAVNLLAGQLTDRFGLRLDMTGNQLYQISDTTVEVLQGLEKPVSVNVLSAEGDFVTLVAEVLDEYVRQGRGRVELTYTDPYADPTVADGYLQRGLQVTEGTVVVEGEYYARAIPLEDMFVLDDSGENIQSLRCEQELTSAILYAAGNSSPVAAFTAGHNENASEGLVRLFTQSNYEVSNISLSMEDIAEGCDLLVIASPSSDFSADEIRKLDDFMAKGGRLMVFLEPISGELANLKGFLREWGIGVTDTVVAEALQYTDSQPVNLVPVYSAHEINQYFSDNQIYLVMPSSRALEQVYVSQGGVRTHKLLYSTDRAYDSADPAKTAAGPYALAMVAEKELADGGKARIFAAGSRGIYGDQLLAEESRSNAKFISQVMNWCTETESAVSIPAKLLGDASIAITISQVALLALLLVVVLPLGMLIYGLGIYRKRRRS